MYRAILGFRNQVLNKLDRIIRMAQTISEAIADLTAIEQKQAADIAKMKTDVATALAAIGSGPLTADQQAAVDSLKAAMGADDAAVNEVDASVAPQPPTP